MLVTALSTLSYIAQGMFLLFLLRAAFLFVQVGKMADGAERTNMRARARTTTQFALLCLLAAFGFRAYFFIQGPEAQAMIESARAETLPAALMVDGQPIDTLCFADAEGMDSPLGFDNISVRNCGADLIVKERGTREDGTAFVSYAYSNTDDVMSWPYAQYQYIGEIGNDVAVLVNWSGGGTGHFSTLMLVAREGDRLIVKSVIAGGDRCNGGITKASVDDAGRVSYAINITPYDMLVLGGDPERAFLKSVKPFDDLVACAACCYGTAKFTGDDFTGVALNEDLRDSLMSDANTPPELEKQACFDRLVKLQFDAGQTEFTPEGWEIFIREVEHVCLGRAEGE